MMFRLQTMMGTFYATSAREIVHLEGLFMGAGHNVTYEANMGIELKSGEYEHVPDEWEFRGGVQGTWPPK